MASLAYFIRVCQQEERYGTEFVSHVDDRMRTLNFSQLQGMQEVLERCIREGKSHPWRRANEKLLERVNVHIVPRREEAILNEQKKEKTKREAYVKRMNKNAKQQEKDRVMSQILSNAAEQAVLDVKEAEFKRQAAEKARLMELIPAAEDKRNRYFRYVFLYLVVGIVLVAVALSDPLFIGCGIAFVAISAGLIGYSVYKIGIIRQVVVTEEELEQQRTIRREELIQKALNTLKKTEIEFNNRLAKEKEERRAYRAKKRADALAASARLLLDGAVDSEGIGNDGSGGGSNKNSLPIDAFSDVPMMNPESDSDFEVKEDSDIEATPPDRAEAGGPSAEPRCEPTRGPSGRTSLKGSSRVYIAPGPGSPRQAATPEDTASGGVVLQPQAEEDERVASWDVSEIV